jgi:hypothetical protein
LAAVTAPARVVGGLVDRHHLVFHLGYFGSS